jgi:hypothetical protein
MLPQNRRRGDQRRGEQAIVAGLPLSPLRRAEHIMGMPAIKRRRWTTEEVRARAHQVAAHVMNRAVGVSLATISGLEHR